jgi:hypothetical protein
VGPCDLEVVFPSVWSEVRSRVPAAGVPGRPGRAIRERVRVGVLWFFGRRVARPPAG